MPSHQFGRATQLHAAMIAFAVLTAISTVRTGAEETPLPQVVSAGSLPKDCKSLGEVTGKHSDHGPREEVAQEYAVREAKGLGATHVVTDTVYPCGGNSICYEGKAYRCPSAAPASSGK
jgi:hypothetical protein